MEKHLVCKDADYSTSKVSKQKTLKSLLIQLHDENPGLTKSNFDFTDQTELIAVQHDAQHFIFGCGTDVEGEAALQISIFLLTDLKPNEILKRYREEEDAEDLLNHALNKFYSLKSLEKIKTIFKLFWHFIVCISIKATTRNRFPFTKTHEYLDWTVADICKEYNIKPYIGSILEVVKMLKAL
jgi:hypothetical protein